jgi:hypothetical protein
VLGQIIEEGRQSQEMPLNPETRLVKNLKRVEIFDVNAELPVALPRAEVARLVADLSKEEVSRSPSVLTSDRLTPLKTPCRRAGSGTRSASFVREKIVVLAFVKDAVGTLPVRTKGMTAPIALTPATRILCRLPNISMKSGPGGRRLWSAQHLIRRLQEILSLGLGRMRKIKEARPDYAMSLAIGALGLYRQNMRWDSCERLAR